MYIVHLKELEDIVYAGCNLHVWLVVHDVTSLGELEEDVVIPVLLEEWVILVGQLAYHSAHTDILSPFEHLQQGDAVEEFTVKVP